MVRESKLEIIVGDPPKITIPPLKTICHIEKKDPELSLMQEFLFDWFDYIPSEIKSYLEKRAKKLDMGAVYVAKYHVRNKTMLKCYFAEKRLPECVHIPPYNFFQKNDSF
jgi:hypothetical protein